MPPLACRTRRARSPSGPQQASCLRRGCAGVNRRTAAAAGPGPCGRFMPARPNPHGELAVRRRNWGILTGGFHVRLFSLGRGRSGARHGLAGHWAHADGVVLAFLAGLRTGRRLSSEPAQVPGTDHPRFWRQLDDSQRSQQNVRGFPAGHGRAMGDLFLSPRARHSANFPTLNPGPDRPRMFGQARATMTEFVGPR